MVQFQSNQNIFYRVWYGIIAFFTSIYWFFYDFIMSLLSSDPQYYSRNGDRNKKKYNTLKKGGGSYPMGMGGG